MSQVKLILNLSKFELLSRVLFIFQMIIIFVSIFQY